MRFTITAILSLAFYIAPAQFDHDISVSTNVNFQVGKRELGNYNASAGVQADISFWSKKRFQPLVEATMDRFIGKGDSYTSPRRPYKPFMYSVRGGLRYFINRRTVVSAVYGPTWHTVRPFETVFSGSMTAGFTLYPDKSRRMVFRVFTVYIPQEHYDAQYFGLGLGYRFL